MWGKETNKQLQLGIGSGDGLEVRWGMIQLGYILLHAYRLIRVGVVEQVRCTNCDGRVAVFVAPHFFLIRRDRS